MDTAENNAPVEIGDVPEEIHDPEFDRYVEDQRVSFVARAEEQISLSEAFDRYELVAANYDPAGGSYVIMAERDPGITRDQATIEMGYAYLSPFTAWTREEWNPKLRDKQGLREYYKMKRQDGIIRGSLRMLKTPIQAGRWFIEPAETNTANDLKIADFVARILFYGLNVTWSRLLDDILLCCEYGHMVFEKVYDWADTSMGRKLVLKKLAPRHPLDIREWKYDSNGGPDGIVMEPTEATGFDDPQFIPIEKLAIFSLEAEAGDMTGISVLRSAYKHYYYKDTLYRIDAIQKERHAIGVPIIKLPPGFTTDDKKLAQELGRNLRTNDRAHVVLPPNWEFMFAKLEGQRVDCLESVKHHNEMIQANVLAPFLTDSNVDPRSTDMFMKSTRYIGNTIADVFNSHIIPQLVDINFRLGRDRLYPKLVVRRVGEWEDVRTMSFAFRNFVGAGAIIPDDVLDAFLRKEMDLPPADPATARPIPGVSDLPVDEVQGQRGTTGPAGPKGDKGAPSSSQSNAPTPPAPGRTGLPRQAGPSTKGAGRPNSGIDRSGG
jgi:hypothetical protein